jgi:hypothetical protein
MGHSEHAWTARRNHRGASPCPTRALPKSRSRPSLRNCLDARSTPCASAGADYFATNRRQRLVPIYSDAASRKNCRRTLTANYRRRRNASLVASSHPSEKIRLPGLISPDAVLVRDWKGTAHRVTVAEQGFSYQERTYASLSEIAREITGTRWNGPRFFGLRPPDKSEEIISTGANKRKRGRPSKPMVAPEPLVAQEAGHGL